MKSYRKELWFNIAGRRAFVNITPQVEACLKESGIKEGMILTNTMQMKFIKFRSGWMAG
jgi:thiamine phosphate synthase YjbQ (UPF0047 family)